MKFKDVELYTWLKYKNICWFVVSVENNACYLETTSDEICLSASDFDKYRIEPVQPPVFHLNEDVLCVGDCEKELQNQIVKIIKVDDDKTESLIYLIECNNRRDWATPFDLVRLNY